MFESEPNTVSAAQWSCEQLHARLQRCWPWVERHPSSFIFLCTIIRARVAGVCDSMATALLAAEALMHATPDLDVAVGLFELVEKIAALPGDPDSERHARCMLGLPPTSALTSVCQSLSEAALRRHPSAWPLDWLVQNLEEDAKMSEVRSMRRSP